MSLFSVEALDTRFEPANDERQRQIIARAGPSRWKTPEFCFYGLCFVMSVPLMVLAAVHASSSSRPTYDKFKHLLSPGWLGRPVDNSDMQYKGFRDMLPMIMAIVLVHQALRYASVRAGVNRIKFDAWFGVALLAGLHGPSVLKILFLLWAGFRISRLPAEYNPRALTWAFGVGTLFANELLHGYLFGSIDPKLEFLDNMGLMPRWEVFFKCSVLRQISFNIDYLSSVSRVPEKKEETPTPMNSISRDAELYRIDTPRRACEYSFINLVGYCLYSPLYIAGPILTFNDYVAQSQQPLVSISWARTGRYALRFLICLGCMELILHYIYVVAICNTRAWDGDTPFEISMVALFNLAHIWLKLLLPWRFFRLWALIDGIDPPENMVRCVANNYSALSFWRSWHRSFNRWVTRYLYIPLGGKNRPVLNSLIVFTFVAMWHDIQLRLLIWGWLVVLFVLPEVIAGKLLPAKQFGDRWWYRHVCAVGGVANVWMMMIANLVGFAVGVDGIKSMLYDMTTTAAGLRYVILSSMLLFVGIQVMFEVREREHRNGIDLKC